MNNRKCLICQTEYEYCPSCAEHRKLPAWRSIFDSDKCLNIYNVIVEFRENRMSAKVASKKLKALGVSDNYDNYSESTIKILNRIFAEENSVKEETKETKIEEIIETVAETSVEETPVVEQQDVINVIEKTVKADEISAMKYIPKQRRKK